MDSNGIYLLAELLPLQGNFLVVDYLNIIY